MTEFCFSKLIFQHLFKSLGFFKNKQTERKEKLSGKSDFFEFVSLLKIIIHGVLLYYCYFCCPLRREVILWQIILQYIQMVRRVEIPVLVVSE